jgi:hypothetical protein
VRELEQLAASYEQEIAQLEDKRQQQGGVSSPQDANALFDAAYAAGLVLQDLAGRSTSPTGPVHTQRLQQVRTTCNHERTHARTFTRESGWLWPWPLTLQCETLGLV